MNEILANLLSNLIFVCIAIFILFFRDKVRFLGKFGYKKIQIDLPYDPVNNLVMIVSIRKKTDGPENITIIPQTSIFNQTTDKASMLISEELGLNRRFYVPKKPLGYLCSTRQYKKTYRVNIVEVLKDEINKGIDMQIIRWNRDKNCYTFPGVEYGGAEFLPAREALEIIKNSSYTKTYKNETKREAYEMAFKKLAEYAQKKYHKDIFDIES